MKFSDKEIKDIIFSGVILSLAFAILFSGGLQGIVKSGSALPMLFLIAFFTAGVGFLLHELMHKYVAQKYGFNAEFKAFWPMLWLALAFSFFGFIFAAPGAVFISGTTGREKNGKISVVGPIANIFLSLVFLILLLALGAKDDLTYYLFSYGLSVNSLLAAFNMIPVMPFDGAKVITWSKKTYFATLIAAIALLIVSYFFS